MAGSYVGSELEIFQHATNWKAYYARTVGPYVNGDVLEVGAGMGATSRFLCDGRQRSWTCLEPDPSLLRQLDERLAADRLPSPVRTVCGTVATLGVEERFDTILYIDVLEHIEDDAERILNRLNAANPPRVGDKSDPDQLRQLFGLSKKAFKRAVGRLLKDGLAEIDASGCVRPLPAPPGAEAAKPRSSKR